MLRTIDDEATIVVGAGLAGLVTAWRLQEAGMPAVVLEGSDRIGGRTMTSREGWVDGQFANYGGELVFPAFHALRAVCEELGVELSPPNVIAEPEPDDLTVVEGMVRAGSFIHQGTLVDRRDLIASAARIRAAVEAHPPAPHEIVEQWVRRAGLDGVDRTAFRGVARMLTCQDTWDHDVHYLIGPAMTDIRRISGGTQSLADRLAMDLDVRLGHEVVRIRRGDGVEVETSDGRAFHGARVVVATNPYALSTIGFDPPLEEAKTSTVLSLLPAMGGKVAAQYAEGDAVREALNAIVYTDDEICAAWTCWPDAPAGPAVVIGFLAGVHRHVLADEGEAMRLLDDLVATAVGHPVTRLHGDVHSWWADPRFMSITVNPSEHSRPRIAAVMSGVERDTHIAGDYTSEQLFGTLEGAVRSGIRTADEILRAPTRFSADDIEERLTSR